MSWIKLVNQHLLIDSETALAFFPGASQVCLVYYANRNTLLLAPSTDELFKGLHKTSTHILKDKNLKGDKSISLEEIIIDNELDSTDRELEFKADESMNIITVFF
jgi:hypothetical protein